VRGKNVLRNQNDTKPFKLSGLGQKQLQHKTEISAVVSKDLTEDDAKAKGNARLQTTKRATLRTNKGQKQIL
jgi:hypothetical protein